MGTNLDGAALSGDPERGIALNPAFDYDEIRQHSAVEVQTVGFREFTPSVECVGEVRHFVSDALAKSGIDADRVFECQLVADELATNAVLHAGSIFSVAVELTDTFVRIAVRDDSNAPPVQQYSQAEAQDGHGLVIVSGTVSGWGTVPLGHGKETWADISRPPPSSPTRTKHP
jgi:anti-sigma regulatory factor (Ser/Thr protein kinase)